MRKLWNNKWFKIPYTILLYGFAAYGFFLVATYAAIKFQWTKTDGGVDQNNRYYQSMYDKYNLGFKVDSISMIRHRDEMQSRINLLNNYYPVNAKYIASVYESTQNERLALKMLDLVDLKLKNHSEYTQDYEKLARKINSKERLSGMSAFDWMNVQEWKYFKVALERDKKWIDSAAHVAGVESRTIVACLVGEQVRLFNSRRERFKDFIAPLKRLALEANFSYGVTGIKENTAIRIEENLKNKHSRFYLGENYETLLDYDSLQNYTNTLNDTMSVRLQRLVQHSNHYYSYLYAALYLKQIAHQWEKAGYPIEDRPGILATLFNLGFYKSKPNPKPQLGGSEFDVNGHKCTFGSVAYEFYYSGEMSDLFPYQRDKFVEIDVPKTKSNEQLPSSSDTTETEESSKSRMMAIN